MDRVPDQQILRGASATLSWQALDGDGEPTTPAGVVTVGVVSDDGSVVVAAGTATAGTGSDPRTYALPAASNLTLDNLTATWTDGAVTHDTLIEVVGGYYFSVAEARLSDPALLSDDRYPTALIVATRREVEEEFEAICELAFVPRYRREIVSGTNDVSFLLGRSEVRTVRDLRDYADATSYEAWSAGDLATLVADSWGLVTSRTGLRFATGRRNLSVAYEHGMERPPAEVKRAAMQRLRYRMNMANSGIPDRATSYSAAEGGTYALARAGMTKTGMDDVDAVLARWSRRVPGIA